LETTYDTGLTVAVLGSTYTRLFKDVFAQANSQLVDVFGMPRGKMEVGRDGVAQLIRKIFGDSEDGDELDKKIERTLQVAGANDDAAPLVEAANVASQANGRKRGRPRGEGDE
jgi:melanoma-associated antigen